MSSRLAPEPTLRPATPADRVFLLEVYASTRTAELAVVPWTDAQRAAFLEQQFTAQDSYWRTIRPDAAYDVIEEAGTPVGRLYVDRTPQEFRVVDIALIPAARGRGIGEGLLRGVLDEAGRAGRPVTIHVERGNRARALYERLGFLPVGSTGVYDLLECRPGGSDPDPSETSTP